MFHQSHRRNSSSYKHQTRFSHDHTRTPKAQKVFDPSSYTIKEAQLEKTALVVTHRFSDFPLAEQIKHNIASHGYDIPTPIQDQAIPFILEGKDVVGIANTGTGKTAAFLIPLLHKIVGDPAQKILILTPTRELASQINDEVKIFAKNMRITSVLVIGGQNIERQAYALRNHPNIVIATPGRVKDLVNQRLLCLEAFHTVVLDEVDRMVDIGFIRDITHILSLLPKERQSLFFSATLSQDINRIIQSFLKSPVMVSVRVAETAASIDQSVIRVKSNNEKFTKLHELLRLEEYKKVLIFGRTKWNVKKLTRLLQENGFLADSIHGNKSQNQRLRALEQFRQNRLRILVATDVASRGLDIENVTHVINFDEPSTKDDYIHRIGRTGRADKQGKAITFVL